MFLERTCGCEGPQTMKYFLRPEAQKFRQFDAQSSRSIKNLGRGDQSLPRSLSPKRACVSVPSADLLPQLFRPIPCVGGHGLRNTLYAHTPSLTYTAVQDLDPNRLLHRLGEKVIAQLRLKVGIDAHKKTRDV